MQAFWNMIDVICAAISKVFSVVFHTSSGLDNVARAAHVASARYLKEQVGDAAELQQIMREIDDLDFLKPVKAK